jgi:hypothetical protein
MRIAILLSGQPRFTEDLQLFLNNLKGYDQADWFVYLTNKNYEPQKSVSIVMHDTWVDYDPCWAKSIIKKNLPPNNFLKKFEISDANTQVWPQCNRSDHPGVHSPPEQYFKMFYNIFKTNQLRTSYEIENNFKYDIVIRTRSDVGLLHEVDVRNNVPISNTIIMPGNQWYGEPPCNDQFAIGNSDSMTMYSNIVNHLKEYNDCGVVFHPETLLAHHLQNANGAELKRGSFEITLRTLPLDNNWA